MLTGVPFHMFVLRAKASTRADILTWPAQHLQSWSCWRWRSWFTFCHVPRSFTKVFQWPWEIFKNLCLCVHCLLCLLSLCHWCFVVFITSILCVAWWHQSSEERYLCAIVPCIRFSQHSQLFCYVLFVYINVVGVKCALCGRFLIEWCDPLLVEVFYLLPFFDVQNQISTWGKMLCNSQGNAIKSKQPTCGGMGSFQPTPTIFINFPDIDILVNQESILFFSVQMLGRAVFGVIMLNECFNSLKFLNKDLHPVPYGNICLFSFSISSWVSNTNSLYFSKGSALASLDFFAPGHEPSSSTQLCGLLHPGEPGRSGVIRCAQGAQ